MRNRRGPATVTGDAGGRTSHWEAPAAREGATSERPEARRPARGSRFRPLEERVAHMYQQSLPVAAASRYWRSPCSCRCRADARPSSSSSASKADGETLDDGTWYATGAGGGEGRPQSGLRPAPAHDPLPGRDRADRPRLARRRSTPGSTRSAPPTDFGPQVCQIGDLQSFGRLPEPERRLPLLGRTTTSAALERGPRERQARRPACSGTTPRSPATRPRLGGPAVGQHRLRAPAAQRPGARRRRRVHGPGSRRTASTVPVDP